MRATRLKTDEFATGTRPSTSAKKAGMVAEKKPSRPAPSEEIQTGSAKPTRAKLFLNGRSQAVRLPKEFRFKGKEVQITRQGRSVVLTPVEAGSHKQYWDAFFARLQKDRDLPFPDCEDRALTEPEDIFGEDWV